MKWYEIASDWKRFTCLVKEKWSKLTDADLTTFGGKSDQLAILLQQKYGYAKEQADQEIAEFALCAGESRDLSKLSSQPVFHRRHHSSSW